VSTDDIKTVGELIKKAKVAIMTTQAADGKLVSRPLVVQEAEFDGDLWFFSQDPSQKTDEIATHPQVNIALESGKGYVSVSGHAEVVHDRARVDEYWSKPVEAWFPEGKDDPTIALIVVHGDTAEYWSMDDPKPVAAFKIAKAALTGDQPDIGENRTVEF
jgi:general stress protein 26